MKEHAGACDCKAVRYTVIADALTVYACHCRRCQTRSGSGFAEHALIESSSFEIVGETVVRSRETDGIRFDEVFCASCLTRVYDLNSSMSEVMFLRAGTLSGSQDLEPVAHIWTKRKQGWVALPNDIPLFDESPTPEQFNAALRLAESRRSESRSA